MIDSEQEQDNSEKWGCDFLDSLEGTGDEFEWHPEVVE